MRKKSLAVSLSIVSILLLGAVGYLGYSTFEKYHPASSSVSDPSSEDDPSSVSNPVANIVSNGINVKMVKVSDTEQYFTYTAVNEGQGDNVLVTAGWTDTSYSANLSDYVTITQDRTAKKVTVKLLQVFTKQFKIKLASSVDSAVNATVTVDYQAKLVSVTPSMTLTAGSPIAVAYNIVDSGGSIDLDHSISNTSIELRMNTQPYIQYCVDHASELGEQINIVAPLDGNWYWNTTAYGDDYFVDSYDSFVVSWSSKIKVGDTWGGPVDTALYCEDLATSAKYMPRSVLESCFSGTNGLILHYTTVCDGVARTARFDVPINSTTAIQSITTSDGGLIF